MKLFITFCLTIISTFGFSQKIPHLKLQRYKIAILSDTVKETSGLTVLDDRFFTINDSGNAGDIFELKAGSPFVENRYQTQLRNKDWEAICNDGESFYIGDFGNNLGTRNDLKVYKIPFKKNTLLTDSVKTISFYYPEQTDFSPQNINHNFDAEAMIFLDGNIHIFTKEWLTNTVSHYSIDTHLSENQPAKKLEHFDTGFVITDASLFQNKLYTVGYTKNARAFLMIFEKDDSGNLFFNQPSHQFFLGMAYNVGQIEGIVATEKGLYISNERFSIKIKKVPQSLYFVPYKDLE